MISVILIVVCFILLTKNSVLFLNHKHTKIMLNNNLSFKKKKLNVLASYTCTLLSGIVLLFTAEWDTYLYHDTVNHMQQLTANENACALVIVLL
jgi:hypothetical protein